MRASGPSRRIQRHRANNPVPSRRAANLGRQAGLSPSPCAAGRPGLPARCAAPVWQSVRAVRPSRRGAPRPATMAPARCGPGGPPRPDTPEGRPRVAGPLAGNARILRQLPAAAPGARAGPLTDDLAWLHAFLGRLAGLGFPSPRPLPCFGGRSWTMTGPTLMGGRLVPARPRGQLGRAAPDGRHRRPAGPLSRRHPWHRHGQPAASGATADRRARGPALAPARRSAHRRGPGRAHPPPGRTARPRPGQHRPPGAQRAVIHGDFTNDNVPLATVPRLGPPESSTSPWPTSNPASRHRLWPVA